MKKCFVTSSQNRVVIRGRANRHSSSFDSASMSCRSARSCAASRLSLSRSGSASVVRICSRALVIRSASAHEAAHRLVAEERTGDQIGAPARHAHPEQPRRRDVEEPVPVEGAGQLVVVRVEFVVVEGTELARPSRHAFLRRHATARRPHEGPRPSRIDLTDVPSRVDREPATRGLRPPTVRRCRPSSPLIAACASTIE
jgi:hypothetical protein